MNGRFSPSTKFSHRSLPGGNGALEVFCSFPSSSGRKTSVSSARQSHKHRIYATETRPLLTYVGIIGSTFGIGLEANTDGFVVFSLNHVSKIRDY